MEIENIKKMKNALLLLLLAACVSCNLQSNNIIDVGQDFGPIEYNDTKFSSYSTEDLYCFRFEVIDSTITLTDPATHSSEPLIWDRAEMFISPTETMDKYYCFEIDPNGDCMNYMTEFYRNFHYDWHLSTIKTSGHITDNGYTIEGSIKRSELESLGFDLSNGFYMGLFRGDMDSNEIKWHSYVQMPEGEEPDFHKPGVMFKCIMTPGRK